MKIGIAAPGEVDHVWPKVVAGIQSACERGNNEYCAGDIWTMCRSGHAYLVLVFDGAANDPQVLMASVWRFEKCNITGKHTFHCVTLWGRSMRTWLKPAREYITRTAKENGASLLTACGRQGWVRAYNMTRREDRYEVAI